MRHHLCLALLLASLLVPRTGTAQTGFDAPFNFCPDQGPAVISFELLSDGPVSLVVEHTFTNAHVRTLVQGMLGAGQHQVVWDGRDDDGQLMDTGVYILTIRGSTWFTELWTAINCGYDAAVPLRTIVGGHDVGLTLASVTADNDSTELGIYQSDGTTRVSEFSQPNGGIHFFYWTLDDSSGQSVPAGDYIYRVVSPTYAEDIPLTLDPIERGALSITATDADGTVVTGVSDPGPTPVVKGPLQELTVDFGRPLNAAEMDYVINGGLRFSGFLEIARPVSPVARPDSTGIVFQAFDSYRDWPDIYGSGSVSSYGLGVPAFGLLQLGYDHEGITWRDRLGNSTGPVDVDDWLINPGPFYFHTTGTMDPARGNPVPVDHSAEIFYVTDTDDFIVIVVVDSDGNKVRTLVSEYMSAGPHVAVWDRLDDDGIEVPLGIYHLLWLGNAYDNYAVVCSGDIMISPVVSAVPDLVAVPAGPMLHANQPNPFNPVTTISFDLPQTGPVRLTVLSLDGRRVATLVAGNLATGHHSTVWRGRNDQGRVVPSGTYFYRLMANGEVLTRPMMLLK